MEAPPVINTSFGSGSSNFGKGWTVKGILYGGVDHSLAGNGGPECLAAMSPMHRWVESVIATCLLVAECLWAWNQLSFPASFTPRPHSAAIRRYVTLGLALVFGVEIGFKFCSRTALYLLNPCHILTLIQLLLLSREGTDKVSVILFRVQVYALTGPVLALLFPVLNTLRQPLELEWYYVQHYALLAVPLYLLSLGGAFSFEALGDFNWAIFATSLLMLYHFCVLQPLALLSWVNLNTMLCPAVSDPFQGRWWRTAALCHQHLCVPLVGKFACIFARFLNSISATVPSIFGDEPAEVLRPVRPRVGSANARPAASVDPLRFPPPPPIPAYPQSRSGADAASPFLAHSLSSPPTTAELAKAGKQE